ncbi:MAG: response regulator transcription factor [Solirubrobacterales bacterium]
MTIDPTTEFDPDKPLVLVADDNQDIRDLLATRLASRGFEVVTAADGQAALDAALEHRPAIAVLDWVMPVIQGHELCVKLKSDARTAAMPIVMLTARGEEEDRLLGLDLGADDYLIKPFDIEVLGATLNRLIEGTDQQTAGQPRS